MHTAMLDFILYNLLLPVILRHLLAVSLHSNYDKKNNSAAIIRLFKISIAVITPPNS